MAEMITITVNGEQIKVPAWATQQSQQDFLDAINKIENLTKAQKDAMKTLVNETAKGNGKEVEQNKKLIDAINEISDDTGSTRESKEGLDIFSKGLKLAGSVLGTVIAGLSLFANSVKGLGEELRGSGGGTGLDLATGGSMDNAAVFRTSMKALGYSAEEMTARFEATSDVIAVLGREGFRDATAELQNLTGAGSNLGLSLVQVSEALDNDLKLRKALGILDQIDGMKQAKQSASLFEMQLKATTMLGKSIEEISGAADDTLTDSATVSLLLQSMGEGAQDFTNQVQMTASELSAAGLGQGVNNAIQQAMLESVAFGTDMQGGGDLFKALTTLDAQAGSNLAARIKDINLLAKSDPAAAQELMAEFGPALIGAAKNLTDEQLAEIRPVIEQFGALGQQMVLSIGQLRQSKDAADGFNVLAQSAATVDNAIKKFNSSLGSTSQAMMGAFGAPISRFVEAFTQSTKTLDGRVLTEEELGKLSEEQLKRVKENKSVFAVLNEVLEEISEAFADLFGTTEGVSDSAQSLAQLIRDRLNPFIRSTGKELAKWISELKADDVKAFIDNFIAGLRMAFDTLSFFASVVKKLLSFVIVTETNEDGVEVVDLSSTFIRALGIAFAASAVRKAATGLFTMGTNMLGEKIGSMFTGGGAGAGKQLEKTGKSAGKGAQGLLAFAAAAAGVGVALMGISMAMETFKDMSWGDIAKGVVGITAALIPFGVAIFFLSALATGPQIVGLFAIAAVLGAIGLAAAGIGVAAGGIAMLVNAFGSTSEEKIAEQDATTRNIKELADIDKAQLDSTAKGIETVADAMKYFGKVTNEGIVRGPDISDMNAVVGIMGKLNKLDGSGLTTFSDSIYDLVDAIEELGSIDTAKLAASTKAIEALRDAGSKNFTNRFFDTADAIVDRLMPAKQPQVRPGSIMPASAMTDANGNPIMPDGKKDPVLAELEKITHNTSKGVKATKNVSKEMQNA